MKYLTDGQAVEVIADLPHDEGFVVKQYVEDTETGDLYLDDRKKIVRKVFDAAPVAHIERSCREAEERLHKIQSEISTASNELRIATQERKTVLEKLQQVPALRRLEDWLDGKVTHFVTVSYGDVRVLTKDELKCQSDAEDRWRRPPCRLKLLTLFGDTSGELNWRANQYRDGSGSSDTECHMCCSDQEAKELAGSIIERELSSEKCLWLESLVQSADMIGHPVDQKFRDTIFASRRQSAEKSVADAEKALVDAKTKLSLVASSVVLPQSGAF